MSNTLSNLLSAIKTMDLSVSSNIIFVAVTAAVCVAFLAVIIGVIVRGKRKPNAFDIIVRVLASVILFGSAVLYAVSWLCRTTGDVFIDSTIPALIIGDTMRELPMPALFAALETMLGSILMLAVLLLSLIALICDCLIANKKKDSQPVKAQKSPEEIKREAEIARIRRLADSAVKKTSSAATSNKDKEEEHKQDSTTPETVSEEPDEEPDFDWRVEQPKKQSSSFVGISERVDDDFDSFDTFDDTENETSDEHADEYTDEHADEYSDEYSEKIDEISDESENNDYNFDITENDVGGDDQAEQAEQEQIGLSDEEPTAEVEDDFYEHKEEDYDDETVQDHYSEPDEKEKDEWADEYIEPDRNIYIPEIRTIVREPKSAQKPEEKENKPTRSKPNAAKAAPKKPAAKPTSAKPTSAKPTTAKPTRAKTDDTQSALNKPMAEEKKPTSAKSNTVKAQPKKTESKPKNVKTASDKPDTAESAPKKTAAKKPSGVKNGDKSDNTSARTQKPANSKAAKPKSAAKNKPNVDVDDGKTLTIPKVDSKKLPMTRRYVIINRTNAVNIFSEYLKAKDESEKEKLESSISTIILK